MKIKVFILSFFLWGCSAVANAQSFYEIKWTDDAINYTALIIYYDLNEITVRVKYKTGSGNYKVAEYKCKGEYEKTADGKRHFVYNGTDAKVVYNSNKEDKSGYVADNFIFQNLNDKNEFQDLYAIDDAHLTKTDYKSYYRKATFKKVDPAKEFTLDYLRNYFEKDEVIYKTLVKHYLESKTSNTGSYRISALNNNNTEWNVIMSKGTVYQGQSWKTDRTIPEAWIKEKWALDYEITSVAYGNNDWAIVVSAGSGYTTQSYMHDAAWPATWVNEMWGKDYDITSVAYGDGKWMTVMSKGTTLTQSYKRTAEYPQDWIKEMWDKEYYVTSVAYGNGEWLVVMSKGAGYKGQTYMPPTTTYPEEWIKKKWAEDYDITAVAWGAQGWTVTMSKGLSYSQTYQTSVTYPSSWIQNKWDGVTTTTTTTAANPDNNNSNAKKTTIYLITVADTYDPSIGNSCRNDMTNISNMMYKIKNELGVDLKVVNLAGGDVTKYQVQSKISGLSVSSNDVLLFYYSGHGYNKTPKVSDFPCMALDGEDYLLEDVYTSLKAKSPRLTLVIGDLCNSLPRTRDGTGRSGEIAFKSSMNFEYNKLARLFLQAKGSMISTSSDYNEFSFSLPDGNGEGAFTKSFIASLVKEASVISGSPGDWSNIFTSSYSATLYNTSHIENQNRKYGQHGFNKGYISY